MRIFALVILSLGSLAASGTFEKRRDCSRFLVAAEPAEVPFRYELDVEFNERVKTVAILGEDPEGEEVKDESRLVLANLDFEVHGVQLKITSLDAGAGAQYRQNFTYIMLSRALNDFPQMSELSDTFIGRNLVGFLEGLNAGLTVKEALLRTYPANIYGKLGFTAVKNFLIRYDRDNPMGPILVDVVFERPKS